MTSIDDVLLKVQRILTSHYKLQIRLSDQQVVVGFSDMSTVCFLRVTDGGKNPNGEPISFVQLDCPILIDVPLSPQLYEWIAKNGGLRHFGALRLTESEGSKGTLALTHTLLGETLDPEELGVPLFLMLRDADSLDDELQRQFGGSRVDDVRKA
jgi:hypothetical protein